MGKCGNDGPLLHFPRHEPFIHLPTVKDFIPSQIGSSLYSIGRSHEEEHTRIFSEIFVEPIRETGGSEFELPYYAM
jgi:hypothetical protein